MISSIRSVYMRAVPTRTPAQEKNCSAESGLDNERKEILSEAIKTEINGGTALTALLFRFPSTGPWGKELAKVSHGLASDIANEHGLVWKIWLEDRETEHAGGIYLFEDRAGAERYREKHQQRLSAMGLTGATANTFSVNTELSVLTMAGASLGPTRVPKSVSTPSVAASC
jgi:Putative mono-oxygenase ydhR